MTLHQVTNTIFKDKFYSLACSVLHANSKENSNVNRESLKESFKYGTRHALLAKALIISAIYSTFQLLARDNANLNCSLFLTLQRKQTYFENKYSSQHPLGSKVMRDLYLLFHKFFLIIEVLTQLMQKPVYHKSF